MRSYLKQFLAIFTVFAMLAALIFSNPLALPRGWIFLGLLLIAVWLDYIHNSNTEHFSDQIIFPLILEQGIGVATLFSITHRLITKFIFKISGYESQPWPFWIHVGIRTVAGWLAVYVNSRWLELGLGNLASIISLMAAYSVYVATIAVFEGLWRYAELGVMRLIVPENWISNLAVFLVFILMATNQSPTAGYLFIVLSYVVGQKKLNLAVKASETDFLTQVANRRAWDRRVKELMLPGKQFGVLFLDIDDFKQVNDTYGHLVGDEVLKVVAQTIKKLIRKEDFVARYGGEEFAALLLDAGKEILTQRAEEIRAGIENTIIAAYGYHINVTVSIGGVLYPEDGTAVAELMGKADERLYLAKKAGKNRVVLNAV